MLIGGDFNINRYSSEKNKKGIHKHSGVFNSIINTYELIDLHMTGGRYTWSNNQETPTLERLDMYLVCKTWGNIFPLAMVYKLPREHSDHNPLIITTKVKQPLKKLSFKFELASLKHPDSLTKVEEIWEKPYHADSAFDRLRLKI